MIGERRLDDGEAIVFMDGQHIFSALRSGLGLRMRQLVVGIERAVDANLVAHLSAQQLIDGQARFLARNIPQRHLDGADDLAPGLERAQAADAAHHVLDVGRVAADDHAAVIGNRGVDEFLEILHLGIAVDALVRDHAQADVRADNRTLEIYDLHVLPPFCVFLYLGHPFFTLPSFPFAVKSHPA